MNSVKFFLNSNIGDYSSKEESDVKMTILGLFFASDVRSRISPFKDWALDDKLGQACSGNITALEKDGNFIELTDLYPEEETPTVLRMTRNQFVKLLNEWEDIYKSKPKEVIIKYENNEFIVETKN